jgi:hypothetical protein
MVVPIGSAIVQLLGGGYTAYKTGQQQYEDRQRQLALQDKQLKQQEEDRIKAEEERLRQIERQKKADFYVEQDRADRKKAYDAGFIRDEVTFKRNKEASEYQDSVIQKFFEYGDLTEQDLIAIRKFALEYGYNSKAFINDLITANRAKKNNTLQWGKKDTPTNTNDVAQTIKDATGNLNSNAGASGLPNMGISGGGNLPGIPAPELGSPTVAGNTPTVAAPGASTGTLPSSLSTGYPELGMPPKQWQDVLPAAESWKDTPVPAPKKMIKPIDNPWYSKTVMPMFKVVNSSAEAFQYPVGSNGMRVPLRNEQGEFVNFKDNINKSIHAAKALYDTVHNYWNKIGVTDEDILKGNIEIPEPPLATTAPPPPPVQTASGVTSLPMPAGESGQDANVNPVLPPIGVDTPPAVAPPDVKPINSSQAVTVTGMMPTDIAEQATPPVSYTGGGIPPYLEVNGVKINVPADIEERTQRFIDSDGTMYNTDPVVIWNYINNKMVTNLPPDAILQRTKQDKIAQAINAQKAQITSFNGQTYIIGGAGKETGKILGRLTDPKLEAVLRNYKLKDANLINTMEARNIRSEYTIAAMKNMDLNRDLAQQRIDEAAAERKHAMEMAEKKYQLSLATYEKQVKALDAQIQQGKASLALSAQRIALDKQKQDYDMLMKKMDKDLSTSLSNIAILDKQYDDLLQLAARRETTSMTGQKIPDETTLKLAEDKFLELETARIIHKQLTQGYGSTDFTYSTPPPPTTTTTTTKRTNPPVAPPSGNKTTATKPVAPQAKSTSGTLPTFKTKSGKIKTAPEVLNDYITSGMTQAQALERVNSMLKANGQPPLVLNKKGK